jgi:hypothetical protein
LHNRIQSQKKKTEKDKTEKDQDKAEMAKVNKEELLQDWKKSSAIFNLFESSLNSIDLGLINSYEMYNVLHEVFSSGLQMSALRFQNQPAKAVDTLKLAISMQEIQKVASTEMVEKRWKDLIDKNSLNFIKNFQQEQIEMIGVRGINQVLKMKEDSTKEGSQQPAPTQGGVPSEKIDFDAAISFMKDALTEGDKINSFYEVSGVFKLARQAR